MADKLTEKQVVDLQTILRTDASVDAKVAQVTAVKSSIKQHNVPDALVAPIFECLRSASTAQHAALVNAGFTGLNHLLTRLSRQEPKLLAKEAARTLPLVIEKLGDQKEKYRALAAQALGTLYAAAPMDVERSVRNTAMVGKNARAKEASMQWLLQMHQESGLQFRSYVPLLMDLLEDADGMVREVAKTTVIELFRNAPNAAKSDLKKQLKNFKVRPAIEQAIVKELAPTGSTRPETPADAAPAAAPIPRPNFAASVSSLSSERPMTPMQENRAEAVEPSYVNTQRELDEIFKEMQLYFEGRETEQNWLNREKSMTRLRRLIAGNAPADYPDAFLAGLRGLLDGIIKATNSLRTSLSKEGCSLVQDMATTFGPGIDPMVELLLQTFIKLCAATKKIASQLANTTVDIIIGRVSYSSRIMQHIWGACQDKNVQPRTYATGWLKTLLNKEAHHKSHIEHGGGLDTIEKCIRKGLNDPNPGVREKMRGTYWMFAGIWPARAEVIMSELDSTAQKLLAKDPNNPSSPKKTEAAARPGLGLSKSTMGGKPSLRETMLAQKKALAARNLPARPGSAMAHFSPARTVSNSSATSTASVSASAIRTRPEGTIAVGGSGLSVAPMRPAKKRPEIAARPATAGPYSVRTHDGPSLETGSPTESLKSKTMTPKPMTTTSPRRTAPRTRPGHAAHASESSLPSPTRGALAAAKAASPKASPAKLRQNLTLPSSSPSRANEELTRVLPSAIPAKTSPQRDTPTLQKPVATVLSEADNGTPTPSKQLKVYEDPFTEDQDTPRPTFTLPVLEDRPVNEDAAALTQPSKPDGEPDAQSPEKARQNSRLLDSGITRVKAKSLDVHGFRKLQSLIRENKAVFADDKFEALLLGLFDYLEAPMAGTPPDKAQDVRAQILATAKLLLRRERDSFQPHVSRCLEGLLRARAAHDARSHVAAGLELLADELAGLGDAGEIAVTMARLLQGSGDDTAEGRRRLSMGLHVLRQLLESRPGFVPSDGEVALLAALAVRCLGSADSGVRMDAVHMAVALHGRVGDARFWEAMKGVGDDPKSLITYYIVKRQREAAAA